MAIDNNIIPIVPGLRQPLHEIDLAVRTAIEQIELLDPIERIVVLYMHVGMFKQMARQWGEAAEKKLVSLLLSHGDEEGPAEVNVGHDRYYVGAEKKVTPVDNAAILEALLIAGDGDVSTVVQALSPNPWRQGQVRHMLGDAKHAELFRTQLVTDLKTGKPRKGLRCVDVRFVGTVARATECAGAGSQGEEALTR